MIYNIHNGIQICPKTSLTRLKDVKTVGEVLEGLSKTHPKQILAEGAQVQDMNCDFGSDSIVKFSWLDTLILKFLGQ